MISSPSRLSSVKPARIRDQSSRIRVISRRRIEPGSLDVPVPSPALFAANQGLGKETIECARRPKRDERQGDNVIDNLVERLGLFFEIHFAILSAPYRNTPQ